MNEKKWEYHFPVFESDKYNKKMMVYSPWSGHRNFAYDYICFKKPQMIIELGSYYGCSAFTFLQAIKDKSLTSRFYGIDTWQGDHFTKEDYREDIYTQYKRIQDRCFDNQNANMLKMSFDKANKTFADKSIDLLHIDGSHKYEDVKHDFLLWKDKVKADGVVFFHDVGKDKLLGEEMGSHIFWEEVKQEYEYTIEFPFSFGLGILFFSETEYSQIIKNVDLFFYQSLINQADVQNKDIIRKNYFEIREIKKYNKFLEEQIQNSSEELDKYQEDSGKKSNYIAELEQEQGNMQKRQQVCAAEIERLAKDRIEAIAAYEKTIAEKEGYITELNQAIAGWQRDTAGKDGYINELLNVIKINNETILERDKYCRELEAKSEILNEQAKDNQELLANREADIAQQKEQLTKLHSHVSMLETALCKAPFGNFIYKRLENTSEGKKKES